MTPYRDLLDQFGHEADRALNDQRQLAGLYGLAVTVASAAAIALVAQGLGDSKDPFWFRITCLGDVVLSLLTTVAVIRSLHLYDFGPVETRKAAAAAGLEGDDLAELILEEKFAAIGTNIGKLTRARDWAALCLTMSVITAVLGGVLLIH